MPGALLRSLSFGIAMLSVSVATVVAGVACSSSSDSPAATSGGTCQDAGSPPDGSCGAVTAEILKNGGTPGVCKDTSPGIAATFGKACSALGDCSQCTQCDVGKCNALFDAGH
jgi:hypothetical protein